MRRFTLLAIFAVLTALAVGAPAQTYTPAAIRFDMPPGTDTAEPLHIANLPANAPLSKEQIETALGRLADTGKYSDISYTVNAKELLIKLTPTSTKASPVIYGNLVWWKPGELEPLLEARVPGFHGELPAAGTLTDQVEAALTDLLQQKGIHAKLAVRMVGGDIAATNIAVTATDITVEEPRVVVSELHLQNTPPALSTPLSNFANSLQGQDFDLHETYDSIHETVASIFHNAGYLDATNAPPAFSEPRKVKDAYAVDVTTSITPGEIYHISRIDLHAAAPASKEELLKVIPVKVGDPAGPPAFSAIAKVYADYGYFNVKTTVNPTKDSAAHTVAYEISCEPGDIYHLSSVDTSALTPEQQAAFAHSFHTAPGTVADRAVTQAISQALAEAHISRPTLTLKTNPANHTVGYAIRPSTASAQH